MGFFSGEISLKIRGDYPALREEIISTLSSNKGVAWISSRDGKYDLMLGWYSRTIPEADALQRDILKVFSRHVALKEVKLYSRRFMFRRGYFGKPRYDPIYIMMEAKPQHLTDETDERLLALLSGNARAGLVEMGKELGLSPAQVQHRVKTLKEKGVIIGSRPLLDLSKLGYGRWRLNFQINDYSEYENLLGYAASHPNSVRGHEVLGTPDMSIEFETKGYEHTKQIEDEFKDRFGQAIAYIETTRFAKLHKSPSLSPM
jgi:DNA-binding Lrp family transcriptional regulator